MDEQYKQAKDLFKYLTEKGEISMLAYVEPTITKNFLLQCASFHEAEVLEILKTFSELKSMDERLSTFVKNFLIERKFNRLFNDNQRNVNQFLGFFGEDFKQGCLENLRGDEVLKKGSEEFMELIKLRNQMIHRNLTTYNLEKTIDEVYALHNGATIFVQYLRKKLLT